jgi:hypothetical protein
VTPPAGAAAAAAAAAATVLGDYGDRAFELLPLLLLLMVEQAMLAPELEHFWSALQV